MRRGIVFLFAGSLLVLVACGVDEGNQRGAAEPNDCNGGRYFLVSDPLWEFREAVDYPGEFTVDGGGPAIDWFAEYERTTPIPSGTRADSLSLMGHPVTLGAFRDGLPGWEPEETTVRGLRALAGPAPPDDPPAIVAIAVEDNYTVGVVSYGLNIEELVRVADGIDRVCQREWFRSGGRLAECLPRDTRCLSSTTTSSSSTSTTGAPLPTTTTAGS